MDNNKLLCLNNLIYQIYNIDDFDNMKTSILMLMNTIMPNTCTSIIMADYTGGTVKLSNPICVPNSFVEMEENYSKMEKYDYSSWILMSNQAKVINASSLMPEEMRINTKLYQEWLKPYGLHYMVDMTIVYNGKLMGIMSVYRTMEEGDFSQDEIRILRSIGEHLNARFYKNRIEQESSHATRYPQNAKQLAAEYSLTQREFEVLFRVFEGATNEEICSDMCITANTLKKHLQNLYKKLHVSGRMQLLRLGL